MSKLINYGRTKSDLNELKRLWTKFGLDIPGYQWTYDEWAEVMLYEGINSDYSDYILVSSTYIDHGKSRCISVLNPINSTDRRCVQFNKSSRELLKRLTRIKGCKMTRNSSGSTTYVKFT